MNALAYATIASGTTISSPVLLGRAQHLMAFLPALTSCQIGVEAAPTAQAVAGDFRKVLVSSGSPLTIFPGSAAAAVNLDAVLPAASLRFVASVAQGADRLIALAISF